jgi:hypothetical protein
LFEVLPIHPNLRLVNLWEQTERPGSDLGDIFHSKRLNPGINEEEAYELRFNIGSGVVNGHRVLECHPLLLSQQHD